MVERAFALIKGKGWSISEFERRLDVSTGTFNGWRLRKAIPDKQIERVAFILGTTEAYLRGETDDPSAASSPASDERIEILARAARKMTDEEKDKLIEMAKVLFKKAFDEDKE